MHLLTQDKRMNKLEEWRIRNRAIYLKRILGGRFLKSLGEEYNITGQRIMYICQRQERMNNRRIRAAKNRLIIKSRPIYLEEDNNTARGVWLVATPEELYYGDNKI